jgi:hypothetical protein
MGLYNPEDAEPLTTWLVKNLDAMQVFLNILHSWLTVHLQKRCGANSFGKIHSGTIDYVDK